MEIITVNTFEDVIYVLQDYEYDVEDYFKAEVLRLEDGRWRIGIIINRQMELPLE